MAESGANRVHVIDMALLLGGTNNGDLGTVAVGASPTEVLVDPETNRVYAVNSGGTSVTVLNGATAGGAVPASFNSTITLPGGSAPVGLALNTTLDRVVVSQANGNLAVINTTNDSLITDAAFC